jgi:hypothetical protein
MSQVLMSTDSTCYHTINRLLLLDYTESIRTGGPKFLEMALRSPWTPQLYFDDNIAHTLATYL